MWVFCKDRQIKMPSAADTAEGIKPVTPKASKEITMSSEFTSSQVDTHEGAPKVWQSWASVARYVIVQLASAIPIGLLVWLAYVQH
jgi:hypothetical protein